MYSFTVKQKFYYTLCIADHDINSFQHKNFWFIDIDLKHILLLERDEAFLLCRKLKIVIIEHFSMERLRSYDLN